MIRLIPKLEKLPNCLKSSLHKIPQGISDICVLNIIVKENMINDPNTKLRLGKVRSAS